MKAKKEGVVQEKQAGKTRNIVFGMSQSAHLFFIRGHDRDAVSLVQWGAESCAENEKLRQRGKEEGHKMV
jgi:hypothetical protein